MPMMTKQNAFCLIQVITIVIVGVLSNQCPSGAQQGDIFKLLKILNPNTGYSAGILDLDYDPATGDFFYMGGYARYNYYITRADNKGNFIWKQLFNVRMMYYSLVYSPLNDIVYTSYAYSGFTFMLCNATSGARIVTYRVSGLYNDAADHFICKINSGESAIYCNGYSTGQAMIRFDTATHEIRTMAYPSRYINYYGDLVPIGINELFFHSTVDSTAIIHFLKVTYDMVNNIMTEDYHQTLDASFRLNSLKVALDTDRQRIWQCVENNEKFAYYQQSYVDFSIIGSKYVSSQVSSNLHLQTAVYANDMLYLKFEADSTEYLMKVSSQTPGTTTLLRNTDSPAWYIYTGLLISDQYLNIAIMNSHGIHIQVPLSFQNNEGLPLFSPSSDLSFSVLSDNSFDLTDQTKSSYGLTLQTKSQSGFTVSLNSELQYEALQTASYVLSIPEVYTQNFTVDANQNVNQTIDLPCSLVSYGTLSYNVVNSDQSELPSWITINYTSFEMQIEAPALFQTTRYSFIVNTTYPDGWFNHTFNIWVLAEDQDRTPQCPVGYEWRNDTWSCELNSTECSTGFQWNNTTSSCQFITPQCPTKYEWKNATWSCELNSTECSIGFQWDNATSSCQFITPQCPVGYEWRNVTWSCELNTTECSTGFQWDNTTLSCKFITPGCPTNHIWQNNTWSCEFYPPGNVPNNTQPNNTSQGDSTNNTQSNSTSGGNSNNTQANSTSNESSTGNTFGVSSFNGAQTNNSSEGIKCSTFGPSYKTTRFTVRTQVAASIGIIIGLTIALITNTSIQKVWTLIHYLQLVLILPLIAISMSERVQEFVASNAFAAFSLYPLSSCAVQSIPLFKYLSFDQPDEYLRILGWSSGSTIVNNIVLLMILSVLAITHILFYLVHQKIKIRDSRCRSIILKVYKVLTFSVYIRAFIIIYMFTTIMILSEIKYYIKNGGDDEFGHKEDNKVKGNYVSLTFSFILFILLLLSCVFAFISWKRNKDSKEINESCKTRELYYGILQASNPCFNKAQDKKDEANMQRSERMETYKQQNESNQDDEHDNSQDTDQAPNVSFKIKLARLYYVIFLARRLVLTILIILIPDSLFALKVSFILPLQIAYLAYSIFVRSFAEIKDRVMELCNEIIILVLISYLIKYHSKDKWTSAAEYEFIGIILFQVCILSIAFMISSAIELVKFLKLKTNLTSVNYEDKEVCMETSRHAEVFNSIGDQPSQNLPVIPQEPNLFVAEPKSDQDMFEEDKKESEQ